MPMGGAQLTQATPRPRRDAHIFGSARPRFSVTQWRRVNSQPRLELAGPGRSSLFADTVRRGWLAPLWRWRDLSGVSLLGAVAQLIILRPEAAALTPTSP